MNRSHIREIPSLSIQDESDLDLLFEIQSQLEDLKNQMTSQGMASYIVNRMIELGDSNTGKIARQIDAEAYRISVNEVDVLAKILAYIGVIN